MSQDRPATDGSGANGGEEPDLSRYVCPMCHGVLDAELAGLTCTSCGAAYPLDPYPDFMADDRDASFQGEGINEGIVHNEDLGMVHKAREFYAPELERLGPLGGLRVLDDGSGTGKLVDELRRRWAVTRGGSTR